MKHLTLRWTALLCAAALGALAQNQPYRFSALAGRPYFSHTDAAGGLAGFASPTGVAIDRNGTIYVADFPSNTIRKISAAGVVTTFAGSPGEIGSADGTGSAARFNSPFGLGLDQTGNLFVADTHNHTIRRITPAGEVSTWAGLAGVAGSADGDRTVARFDTPTGVAVDRNGMLYVADFENNTVRTITPGGLVATLAGEPGVEGTSDGRGSAAHFIYPTGVAVDGAGNVYLGDPETALRRITPAGDVTTLSGFAPAIGPNGVALGVDGSLYFTELYRSAVSRVFPNGTVTTLAGPGGGQGYADGVGAAASFHLPYGLTVDAAGTVYVADASNGAIRKVTAAGVVTTYAGRGPSAGGADGIGLAAQFNSPRGVAVDPTGSVYVADTFNSTIRKIGPGGRVTTFAGAAGETGPDDGTGAAARFGFPTGIASDRAGNLYVADLGNQMVRKITPAGVVTTLAGAAGQSGNADGTGAAARFNLPNGVAVDAAGNLYIADLGNATIRKITPAGQVNTLAGTAGQSGGADGVGSAARFVQPAGVAVDDAGNVYVCDRGAFTVRKITPGGVVTTIAGLSGVAGTTDGVGSAARFAHATGIAIDRSGVLYVADGNDRLRRIALDGTVTTITGDAGAYAGIDTVDEVTRIYFTAGVAVDATGNLYLADDANNTVRVAVPTTPSAEVITASHATTPIFGDNVALGSHSSTTLQWQRNGTGLTDGANSSGLLLGNFQPEQTGLYTYTAAGLGGTVNLSDPAVVGLTTTSKVVGAGTEVAHGVFVAANGNTFDQVLLTGPAASITAEPGKITRTSFLDENGDIVQVEFSGAGTLSIVLDDAVGPAPAANYNQPGVNYMSGHAGIVITGADETTNVSVFTVGSLTAVDQSLFKPGVVYDGVAEIAFIAIASANGQFGGVRAANANFVAVKGLAGIYAPGVNFNGPIYVRHIAAIGPARSVLLLGSAAGETRVTGGNLLQGNGQPVEVSGVSRLKFTDGSTSHGVGDLPAQLNRARFTERSVDVTDLIVVDAAHPAPAASGP